MQPSLKLVTPEAIELSLRVTDPEIVAELARREEPAVRDAFALAALRVGVLALKQAVGSVDERAVRDAGREMLAGMEQALKSHRDRTVADLAAELRTWFDRQTGAVPTLVENLVRPGGTLDSALMRHVGRDTSTLAQTLTAHVGAQSPLFQILSPEQKSGLLARLEDLVRRHLEDQRTQLLGQFDLNRADSALSRLVQSMKEGQGGLEKSFRETIGKLASEWSLDNDQSSVARFKRNVSELIEKMAAEQRTFQESVLRELSELRARRATEAQTPRKGLRFEEALGGLLRSEAEKVREAFEAVGATTGQVRHCKKGDFVLEMGPDSAVAGARVVVEAKDDRAYGVQEARAEIAEARTNRRAQIGVFVFSRAVAPPEMARFQRFGEDILVVWDQEDPGSDLWVQAALEVARALIVRTARAAGPRAAGLDGLEKEIGQLEANAKAFGDISVWASTIGSNAAKIQEEARKLTEKTAKQVAALREVLTALRE